MKKTVLLLLTLLNLASLKAQVTPLITTNWNQGCNYNADCPVIAGGACGKAYTGCYATAIAQVLKYNNHPTSAWGGNFTNTGTPSLTVNYDATTYNFASMPNSLSSSNTEVAKLIYTCGVANNMTYSSSNSTSFFSNEALKRFFKYSLSVKNALKATYTNMEWQELLKAELNEGRVIFVQGGSHFYLIDGYNASNLFHCNFGWGGSYNGYYSLSNITAGGINYTPSLAMIGIKPLTQIEISGANATDTISIGATGGNINYQLASLNGWTLSSTELWNTPVETSGTLGYKNLSTSIGVNNSYLSRTSKIIASDGVTQDTLVIIQGGITPTLSLNQSTLTFSPVGETINVNISTDSSWVATTSDPWISISPDFGVSNATVGITTLPNSSIARTGNVVFVRGNLTQTVNIFQTAAGNFWCVPSLAISGTNGITNVTLNTINRTSLNNEGYVLTNDTTILKLDSTYTINVTFVGSNAPAIWIDWNIDGDFNDPGEAIMPGSGSWYPTFNATKTIAITVPISATEGFTRMRVYSKNFGTGPVSGPCNTSDLGGDIEDYVIKIRDHNFIDVDPSTVTFLASAGLQNLSVFSDSTWVVSSIPSWINLTSSVGTGNAIIDLSATENTSLISRSAALTFTRGNKTKLVSVNQNPADTVLVASTNLLPMINLGGVTSFDIVSNISYNIISMDPWITSDLSSGVGNSSILLSVEANTGNTERTGLVVVQNGSFSQNIYIAQDSTGTQFSINPTALHFSEAGGNDNLTINTSNSWVVNTSDNWYTIDAINGTGIIAIAVSCDPNPTSFSRFSDVIFTDGIHLETITIEQDGLSAGINELNKNSFSVYPNPSAGQLTIDFKTKQIGQTIFVYNSIGVLIQTIKAPDNSTSMSVDIPSGIYYLKSESQTDNGIKVVII